MAFLAVTVAACGTNKGSVNTSVATETSTKLTGIWKMLPLGVGIANVVELTPTGESRLYPYNCITQEKDEPEIGRYKVDPSGRAIQLEANGTVETLKILSISDTSLMLSQDTDGEILNFRYQRGSDLTPLCGSDARWAEERAKRSPYAPSDFVPNPVIPPHPGMDRYVGQWANERGEVQVEVRRLADGSYQLHHDADKNWKYLYNAVHWEGDELRYVSFAYSDRTKLFDHPYHKSSTTSFLVPMPNGSSMKYGFFISGKKYEYVTKRK
ncbi:hypothetical protein C0Q88_12450 [Ralstonia pickettii]|uniref:Uncharacterized protein n=2 Tax=Ralstonia pickettii TaxID=329 RepID=A0A2N4TSP6_RALPI|nr:hypothetical protein C0Q88_12450 [Ralstonia pickettii]